MPASAGYCWELPLWDSLPAPEGWCGAPPARSPFTPSASFQFIQDALAKRGDTDRYGDRQGGEFMVRVPTEALGLALPPAALVVGGRSMIDTSQSRRVHGTRQEMLAMSGQRDEVPAYLTLGYETERFGGYIVAGSVNDDKAVRTWHDLKLWEHGLTGPRTNRTSPLSSEGRILAGALARFDEEISLRMGRGLSLSLSGTVFGQATTAKVEAGAAMHVAFGNWDRLPRMAVSNLPLTDVWGTGVWVGVEASEVASETVSAAAGTQSSRMSVVGGLSVSPGAGWPALSVTARRMLTEQVKDAGHAAVGEYRLTLTVPFDL